MKKRYREGGDTRILVPDLQLERGNKPGLEVGLVFNTERRQNVQNVIMTLRFKKRLEQSIGPEEVGSW